MKNLKLLTPLLMFVFCLSCETKSTDEPGEPVEIAEYSLAGTNCGWVNLENGKVAVINSNEELKKYMNCDGDNPPEIDFTKYTLLVASGIAAGGVGVITSSLNSAGNGYILTVEITLNDSTIAGENWVSAAITCKITVNQIELKVLTIQN